MLLTIREICKFADCNVQSRNFVEGEKCLNSKYFEVWKNDVKWYCSYEHHWFLYANV